MGFAHLPGAVSQIPYNSQPDEIIIWGFPGPFHLKWKVGLPYVWHRKRAASHAHVVFPNHGECLAHPVQRGGLATSMTWLSESIKSVRRSPFLNALTRSLMNGRKG